MTKLDLKKLLLGTSVLAGVAFGFSAPTYAQDAEDVPQVEEVEEDRDEVVVTGSRLKKDTFQSVTPLQVITTDSANEEGLFSPVEILQTNSAAGGQQIDSTFQGFVLDNGPGSETIDLRGLAASRTLVLLNGRRMAPAGVEGAPTQPSINLIPRTMVDSFDLLLDGASSVYGSDAVAGVVNVILNNDYDGLEISVEADSPESGAGQDYVLGAKYGVVGDRGFIGGAIEHRYQDPWTTGDREFLNGCETFREIDENGNIRTVDLSNQFVANELGLSAPTSPCRATRLTQRFIAGSFGSIYYQPEVNNTGIIGFSESGLFGVPLDGDGDGVQDINFWQRSPNGQQSDLQQLVNEQNQTSMLINGEYTFEGEMNITPYFEALVSNLDVSATGQQPQLFPFVPENNPFNPCNINAANGQDCNQAYNDVLLSPEYQTLFQQYYNNANLGSANCFGIGDVPFCNPATFGLLQPTGTSLTARPVIGVRGDRNQVDVNILQSRLTGGFRGELPFLNVGTLKDWEFDVAGVYSWSDGTSSRSGIREDRLDLSLGYDPNTGATLSAPCTPNPGSFVSPLLLEGCVPVNLFSPTLYSVAAGADFATQAERDYLFDSRDFATHYAQTLIDVIAQGDIYSLPGGDVSMLLGASWRKDKLDSVPDDIARDGLFFGFFQDAGAAGERTVQEVYGEVFVPLGTGVTGWREFNLELSGRLTDDEFYGTNETYSVKAGYRPVDSLLLRGTFGTSFRAPNLRELFLRGQSGFNTIGDPCAVPDAAYNALTMTYDASLDLRDSNVLANCVQQGVDPTSFLAGQFDAYSVEINQGGSLTLDPETSDSLTYGFSFEQPFTDAFELSVGATVWEIDIADTIIETGAGFLVNQCYTNDTGTESPFCARVVRDFSDPTNPGVIDIINAGFVNRDSETAHGVDYNFSFNKDDIAIGDRAIDIFGRGQITQRTERNTIDVDDNGVETVNEFVGEFGFPEWQGQVTGGVTMDRWQAAWTTRYIQSVVDEVGDPSEFGNYVDGGAVTCGGVTEGDVDCRRVDFADDYFVHNLSMTYRGDDWNLLVGVRNILNDEPPLVDPAEVFSVNNVPLGSGYDLNGREYFMRVRKSF